MGANVLKHFGWFYFEILNCKRKEKSKVDALFNNEHCFQEANSIAKQKQLVACGDADNQD